MKIMQNFKVTAKVKKHKKFSSKLIFETFQLFFVRIFINGFKCFHDISLVFADEWVGG